MRTNRSQRCHPLTDCYPPATVDADAPARCAPLMARLDPQSLPQHVDRLYRAAWALCGSRHDAEDLVQETFARVLARPRILRGQDELAYLMQVLRNTFLTQRRTAGRRPQSAQATLEDIEPADPRTGDRPVEATQAREIFGAIAALPENYRLALVAVDVVGLSYREAAKALGTREATIATRVFRGRERVAREFADAPPNDVPQTATDGTQPRPVDGRSHAVPREAPGPRGSLV
jgi:RNA polymerase sigma-70 factor (ECF subfamily)